MEKIILWGVGRFGANAFTKSILEIKYQIIGYCDVDITKQHTLVNELEVFSPQEVYELCRENRVDKIIVMAQKQGTTQVIQADLQKNGIEKACYSYVDIRDEVENTYLEQVLDEIIFKWNIDYTYFSDIWVENLMSEVEFWIKDVARASSKYHDDYVHRCNNKIFNISKDKHYSEMEQFVQKIESPRIMDIGCGLAPRFGTQLQNGNVINIDRVDPLAYFYNNINAQFAYDYKVPCKFGMFEYLAQYYDEDSMDVVIVNNALDHCINPYKAIIEIMHILKPGGRLYMRHGKAEGVNGGYTGLHQWNLDQSKNNDFIIWNYSNAVNVTEKISEFAEVKVTCNDTPVRDEQNIMVVIEKKKDFDLWEYVDKEKEIKDLAHLSQKLLEFMANQEVNKLFNQWLTEGK